MKQLRILLSVVLILSVICSLAGCMVIPVYDNYQIPADKVASIQIYDLRICKEYTLRFLETESPVYTLEEEQIPDFLNDLSQIRFNDEIVITIAAVDPSFEFDDWVVRINYFDGSYRLICCCAYGIYLDKNDEFISDNHYGCDEAEWYSFISKYVPEDIFQ